MSLVGENHQNENSCLLPDSNEGGPDAPYVTNPLHPDQMSPEQRLAELAAILAAGVIRLQLRKSSEKSQKSGEISLDFVGRRSGPVPNPGPAESGK